MITGNTNGIRCYLGILLRKLGFFIDRYPAKGTKALICGIAHTTELLVVNHAKYVKAKKNKVPIITMEVLPSFIGMTSTKFKELLNELKNEVTSVTLAKGHITHYLWREETQFIVLSD